MQASYEKHHHCVYTEEAVEAAVTLSSRYIADRQLPDKAIDLLDEAGSRARIAAHVARRDALSGGRAVADAVAPWLELQQVLEAKDEAIKVPSPHIAPFVGLGLPLLDGCQLAGLCLWVSASAWCQVEYIELVPV